MIRIEIPVEIRRPVDEVFAFVTDPARLPEWQDTTVSVTKETDGPVGPGTRLREVRRAPGGRTMESLVEVSAYEPNRTFDLRIVEGSLPIDGRHRFQAIDGGTRIDFTAEGEPTGILRAVQPVLRRLLERQFRAYYDQLKQVLEARNGAAPGA